MPDKVVNLYGDEQVNAFEDAARPVRRDVDDDLSDGEVLKTLADAYLGRLTLHA
jgi:hypothetical protein